MTRVSRNDKSVKETKKTRLQNKNDKSVKETREDKSAKETR